MKRDPIGPKVPRSAAPPVYRPQPTPRVLQTKKQTNLPAHHSGAPAAPASYRPQPTPKVLQTKSAVAPKLAPKTMSALAAGPRSNQTPAILLKSPSPNLNRNGNPRTAKSPTGAPKASQSSQNTIQRLIVFFGDHEVKPIRAQKTQVINKTFGGGHTVKCFTMLGNGELKDLYNNAYPKPNFFAGLVGTKRPKDTLIINGHGTRKTLKGMSAQNLVAQLIQKGLDKNDYSRIVLVACKLAAEDTYDNFARQFRQQINQNDQTAGIEVVAPVGNVDYDLPEKGSPESGGQKLDIDNAHMYVTANYGGGEQRKMVTSGQTGGGFRLVDL